MALTERTEIGSREVLSDGQIQVRTDFIVERDGIEISRTYHRHVLVPGASIINEAPSVQRLAMAEHTPSVVSAYRASITANS
jgi:hypothetical protein